MPSTIDNTLHQIARATEEANAHELAFRLGLTYANLDGYPFNLPALSMLSLDEVKQWESGVYLRTGSLVRVATAHPEEEKVQAFIQSKAAEWGRTIELTVVSKSSIAYLVKSYEDLLKEAAEEVKLQQVQTNHADEEDYFKHVQSIEDLQREILKANTTKQLDVILAGAINQNASDIHIEPGEANITVRFRIDGVLQSVLTIPMSQHHQLVSRIKVLANLKLDETANTQDGRFSLADKGIQADIRISTIPTGHGEGIVMRILRRDMQVMKLEELGFSEYNRNLIEKVIHKPYGLILVTGPTGSGKSTTLYALLNILNTAERKIITLEDPIEYQLAGIQQSQVDAEKGFTFAEGLKGSLRQDPDVVMVGEIRDAETATIALNASLTGHLVLSTLHTNNAVTAHTRLLEMGIQPFLLTGSIQMVIAQRLVRRLVPGSAPENPEFKGRLVIGEVLCPTTDFEQTVVSEQRDQNTLEKLAIAGGMIPILEDGLAKARAGLTTEDEIYRVTNA